MNRIPTKQEYDNAMTALSSIPLFKTIEIDKNFDYDSCRPGSNDCEKNYIHFCYENNEWRRCGSYQIDKMYNEWLVNPLATTYKDTDGETVFALKK